MKSRSLLTYLVDPFKQIRMGLYFIVLSLVFMIASAGIFYQITYEQYANVMKIFNVVDTTSQWNLIANDVVIRGLIKVAILLITYTILTFAMSITLTHKVYGPLVSIHNFIDDLKKGDYKKRITIREKDDLKDLVNKLNDLAEALEKK